MGAVAVSRLGHRLSDPDDRVGDGVTGVRLHRPRGLGLRKVLAGGVAVAPTVLRDAKPEQPSARSAGSSTALASSIAMRIASA